jgi:hypothetical protein
VLDGADGIVLGSETFRGKFPVASVETVLAICRQAEKCFDSFAYYNSVMDYAGYHSLNPDISKVRHTGICRTGCRTRRVTEQHTVAVSGCRSCLTDIPADSNGTVCSTSGPCSV